MLHHRHFHKRHTRAQKAEHLLWVFLALLVFISVGITAIKLTPWNEETITTMVSPRMVKEESPQKVESDVPALKVFIDNEEVTDFDTPLNVVSIELRVTGVPSIGATFMGMNEEGNLVLLGEGERDDLLSRSEVDVWTYEWDSSEADGLIKLYARVKQENGSAHPTGTILLNFKKEETQIEHSEGESTSMKSSATARATTKETALITERVSEPASCTNAGECKIYCAGSRSRERCVAFAQTKIEHVSVARPSLMDQIPDERVWQLLADPNKRPKDLPLLVDSPSKLREYCAQTIHVIFCTQALTKNDMARADVLVQKGHELTQREEKNRQIFIERIGVRKFMDTDGDGITDYDELNIYHTDMNVVDTDGDGFPDGVEILSRTNPRGGMHATMSNTVANFTLESATGSSVGGVIADESVTLDNPQLSGLTEKNSLSVSGVTVALPTSATAPKVAIEAWGHAPENSFVTLYLFSNPIAITVQADQVGNWKHTFTQEFPSGAHEIYATIADEGGRVLIKSEAYEFIKEGTRVTRGGVPPFIETGVVETSETTSFAFGALLLGLLGILLSLIGWVMVYSGARKR